MRTTLALLIALIAAVACVPAAHFADISDTLARRDLRCSSVIVAEYDESSWGFRAEGCGRIAYYRCSFAYETMGRTQCCQRVVSEEAATTPLAPAAPAPYCEDHLQ